MKNPIEAAWIQGLTFKTYGANRVTIQDVVRRDLVVHVDGRGDVVELWSEPWLAQGVIRPAHVYQSSTDCGVVKAWHLHAVHTDQFCVTRGKLQVCLVDLRPESATFCQANSLIVGVSRPQYVKIPPGIMHGWKALSAPEVTVTNLQSHVYDPADEFKFAWDLVLTDLWEPRNG